MQNSYLKNLDYGVLFIVFKQFTTELHEVSLSYYLSEKLIQITLCNSLPSPLCAGASAGRFYAVLEDLRITSSEVITFF